MRKFKNAELNRISVEDFKKTEKLPVVILLDNIRSLYNVGAVFRTADAFMLRSIYLCGITGCPPHREIQKTALGATDSVNWKYFKNTPDAIRELKKEHYLIIGIEQTDQSIRLNKFNVVKGKKYALIFGNEVTGIDEKNFSDIDTCLEIPQSGTKHSLNVAVSVGIVTWEFYHQLL